MKNKPEITIDISDLIVSKDTLIELVLCNRNYNVFFKYGDMDRISYIVNKNYSLDIVARSNLVIEFHASYGFSFFKNRWGGRIRCEDSSMLPDIFGSVYNKFKDVQRIVEKEETI